LKNRESTVGGQFHAVDFTIGTIGCVTGSS
jgi:hypothetical protein